MVSLHDAIYKEQVTGNKQIFWNIINILNKNDVRDIIMEGAKQCIEEAQREYFDLIEIYAKAIEQRNRDVSCLTDTIDIASKCWNDLRNLKVGDRENKN